MMPYIHSDIASEHVEEAKANASRIAYQLTTKKHEYESEEAFISDLTEKVVENVFLTNARYTEKLVMKMLAEAFDIKV